MASSTKLTYDECSVWLTSNDSRHAFAYLVTFARTLDGFDCYLHRQGYLRTFRYATGRDRPYGFIVNRHSLMFYFRKAGMTSPAANVGSLVKHFDDVQHNKRGEIQLRIRTETEAKQLMKLVFGRS